MTAGEILTRATAWIAFAFYACAIFFRLSSEGEVARERRTRWVWSCGLLVYLLHVAAAFHFHHHWSHAAAYADTARQTAEQFGLDWGGGIFGNYFFSVVWLGEVAWAWLAWENYRQRSAAIRRTTQAFFAFMWFNAVVVFAKGALRWLGLGVFVWLALAWWQRRRKKIRAASTGMAQKTSS